MGVGKLVINDIPPRTEDVASVDGIIKAYYEIVSGGPGKPRDWARDKTLYVPGALLVSVHIHPEGMDETFRVMNHQQYAEASNAYLQQGFFEEEIHRISRNYGNTSHVFSTYEYRYSLDGPVEGRGVNSIQLVRDELRWWIVSAVWDTERAGNPFRPEFLPELE